jgi:RimJ/RimL family protein N-acetyltransferase
MVGYILAKDAWGRGYATEALQAITEISAEIGIRRLYAYCHPEHRASSRVLEKCGYLLEGTLPRHTVFPNLENNEPIDIICFAKMSD